MIRKSMPSGHDPMGGYRFFEKDHAQTESWSAMTSHRAPGVFFTEDTGFVSSATSGRNKTARDETIFPFSRRHRETGLGY